jgi:hypothetical protein
MTEMAPKGHLPSQVGLGVWGTDLPNSWLVFAVFKTNGYYAHALNCFHEKDTEFIKHIYGSVKHFGR